MPEAVLQELLGQIKCADILTIVAVPVTLLAEGDAPRTTGCQWRATNGSKHKVSCKDS